MKKSELEKIEKSNYLEDDALKKYKNDREKYLKDKIHKKDEAIDNTLSSFENIHEFILTT